MSRHLMARFRHLRVAGGYDWQRGRPLAWSDHVADPTKFHLSDHDINDHYSAIVHHHEQPFGLEVMPNDYDGAKPWTWGIHQYKRNRSSVWDYDDDRYKGEWLNWISPGEWDHPKGSPAEYFGVAESPEEAMRLAQENWEKHRVHVDAERDRNLDIGGDYRPDAPPRPKHDDFDYGFGDDFGGRP